MSPVRLGLRLALLSVVVLLLGAVSLRDPTGYVADPPVAASPVPAPGSASPATPPGTASPSVAGPTPSARLGTLHAVGLGDSVMSGTNCGCDGIMAEYARELAHSTGRRVSAQNFGVGGHTTQDVLNDLSDDDDLRSALAQADVVVVIIGANDLQDDLDQWQDGGCPVSCYLPDVAAMGQRLTKLLAGLSEITGGHAELLVTNYWNVFTDGRVALASGAQELRFHIAVTQAANREIAARAAASGARLVDLVAPFKGSDDGDPTPLLASDGDHPNAAGVRTIAAALVAAT
ncbi:MAG: SGNH/GDSL hydrolase family protein [Propionibacteriaceae bacterium]|nr:SGNH/GDSL hydrolase family protein [Propionibacteriaceae bacterium]